MNTCIIGATSSLRVASPSANNGLASALNAGAHNLFDFLRSDVSWIGFPRKVINGPFGRVLNVSLKHLGSVGARTTTGIAFFQY